MGLDELGYSPDLMIRLLCIAWLGAFALLFGLLASPQDPAQQARRDSTPWVEQATPKELERVLFTFMIDFPKDVRFGNKFEKSSVQAAALRITPELAITRYAQLAGSSRLTGKNGEAKRMRIDVLGVDPELDLALLRLRPKKAPTGATEASMPEDWPIQLASEGSADDGELHALAWGLGSSGGPKATSISSMLADDSTDRVRYRWLDQAMGSMPVVDGSGWLAGLWRWSAPKDGSMEFEVTSASRIEASVERLIAEAESRGKAKLVLPPMRSSYSLPRLTWPAVSGSPKKQQKAFEKGVKSALAATKRFADEVPCRECGGTGAVSKDVIERVNNGRDKRTTSTSACPDCDGDGILLPTPLWRTARILAAKLTAADPKAANFNQVVRSFENAITATYPVGKKRLLSRIRDSSIEALSPEGIQPGKSILFVLPREDWESRTQTEGNLDWIDGDLGPLLLVAPSTRNVRGEADTVMLAGTLAGQVTQNGELWTVLERTLAVPVRTDGETTGR